jgi:protein TonB
METIRQLSIPRSMILSVLFHALTFLIIGTALEKEYENIEKNLIPKGILLEMGSLPIASSQKSNIGSSVKEIKEPISSKYYHKQNSPHPIMKKVNNIQEVSENGSAIGNSLVGHHGSGQVGDPNGVEASVSEHYLYELKLMIEQNKIYPRQSQMAGHEGKVTVAFTILKDGTIKDVKLIEACPFSKLNDAAIKLIENIKQFKAIPDELGRDTWSLNVPIQYSLR